jgi:hypothetical protein
LYWKYVLDRSNDAIEKLAHHYCHRIAKYRDRGFQIDFDLCGIEDVSFIAFFWNKLKK